jgi:DNA-directed RNA polymerase subunit alpha
MRIRWREFEIPNSVVCEESSRTPQYGKFLVEPFERGFGVTIGNSLRRILLSSLEGAAIVSAKIEGVQHEFSTLPGVYEDVTDIILNLKSVLVSLYDGDSANLKVRADKRGEVRAADIQHGPEVKIINPNLLIATLTQDVPFNVDMVVRKGRGYSTAEENSEGDSEIGVIWIDSSFSPVNRVRYKTEDTRVGQLTNYDRLILEVWTNGTMTPEMALIEASKIFRRHLSPFLQYAEIGYSIQEESGLAAEEALAPVNSEELRRKLELPVSSLDLSVRALNCLEAASVKTIGELVARTDNDLLRVKNFGKTTLHEIKAKLRDFGLVLGMNFEATSGSASEESLQPAH